MSPLMLAVFASVTLGGNLSAAEQKAKAIAQALAPKTATREAAKV